MKLLKKNISIGLLIFLAATLATPSHDLCRIRAVPTPSKIVVPNNDDKIITSVIFSL